MPNNLKNLSEADRKKIADRTEILKDTQPSDADDEIEARFVGEKCPKGTRWDPDLQTCVPE
ncbi:MAG: hypothetical protein WBD16_06770 [Pyrinomonadaceae bacterium]